MKRQEFHFDLPSDLIAQRPSVARDSARLLVVDVINKVFFHRNILDLTKILPTGTICVPNDVKVRHARLVLRRAGGGIGEALLLRALPGGCFEALVRPGARLKPGKRAKVIDPLCGKDLAELFVEGSTTEGLRCVRVIGSNGDLDWDAIDDIGQLPLPKYITHPADKEDEDRYQTVFCSRMGEAVAAPTSGLHFTKELIGDITALGNIWSPIRLHVGLGTFRPMTADNIEDHIMHKERYEISAAAASILEPALQERTNPIMAIGTTSLRAMEAAWNGTILKRSGSTDIFIKPGHTLLTADMLLTNFHLPESTLFVLVSALLGIEFAHEVYAEAIREKYRFFSYGDAMLILHARQNTSTAAM
jgi:S-adenosylmethionine:tRNA ribosyltransferase-isomerase